MGIFSQNEDPRGGCVLKIGEVTSVDPSTCRARVTFDDEDALTSDWLQVVVPNTQDNSDFHMPDVGEDALCVFTGESAETGFILGSFYAGDITPPSSSGDIRMIRFKDGTKITYDRASSVLTVSIGGTTITADQSNVTVETSSQIAAISGGSVDIEGGSEVSIEGGSAVNITSPTLTLRQGSTTMVLNGSSATIESDRLTLKGSLTVTGDMNVQGEISGTGGLTVAGPVSGSNI